MAAAESAAEGLDKRLSYRSMKRTGRKYEHHPRRSSQMGEYPQQQTGRLKATTMAGWAEEGVIGVGLSPNSGEDREKIHYLENPEIGRHGAREPLFMFFEGVDSKRTLKMMATAIRKMIRSR